ncbi:MAG: hypothetical protein H5T85_03785 [Actinobacteria bacterium]|nr:hypothetical protein [Actinomycetota bacterium]
MDYHKASKYLDDCLIFGIKPSLIRIEKVLSLLGNPHRQCDFIHIVGTNGKTSTTKMVANILASHGVRCGYYISPHINTYTERMWINGKEITPERFSKLFSDLYPYVEKVNRMDLEGPMTQFEILTAMMFLLSMQEKLNLVVLEAGMGGRWDATNVAYSKVVGFTGVSLEHTQILGKTIREIALEKAEVIKRGALVSTLCRNKKVLGILETKTKETGSKLFIYGKDFKILRKKNLDIRGWKLDIRGINSVYRGLELPLLGTYQPFNFSLALSLAELYLELCGRKVSEEPLKESILCMKIQGRFEIIKEKPLVILDSSHNPEGIRTLVKNVRQYFPQERKIIIFGVLRDKDYRRMISTILEISDVLILTSNSNERSLNVNSLENEARKLIELARKKERKVPSIVYKIDNVINSLNFALKISGSNDIICITGSIANLENVAQTVRCSQASS